MASDFSSALAPTTQELLRRNRLSIVASLIITSVFYSYLFVSYGWRQASLFLVGLAAGVILYHAAFGFTGAWREVVKRSEQHNLAAQQQMLSAHKARLFFS